MFRMKLKKRKCLAIILVLTLLLSLLPLNLFSKAEAATSSAPTGVYYTKGLSTHYEFYANGTPITIEALKPLDAVEGTVPGYVEPAPADCTAYIVWSISGTKYYIGTGNSWDVGGDSPYAHGTVYGGSTTDLTANTSITMNSGSVYGLFGGNYNSNLTGNTSIDVKGGTIGCIFGGCYGDTGSVSGDSVITVDNAIVNETIYGGNGSGSSSISNTTVNINGGNILQVFGGGGNGTVTGKATVNVSGGDIQYMKAGGLNNKVLGDATINITGGNILYDIQKSNLSTNSKCNLYITGGNVYGNILDGLTPVVSATNNTPLERYTLKVGTLANGQAVSKLVTAVPALGYNYGMNDVKIVASNQIRVYLPAGKTQAAVKAGSTYYKGDITSNAATLATYTPTIITATSANALTSATDTVEIDLNSAITGLSTDDIVVSKDGVALISGTDYTVSDISTTSPLITFTASAGLNSSSVVTVAIEKMDYEISGSPVTLTNNIPMVAPGITTASLPHATVGNAYSQKLTATGDTPITWSVTSGSLPSGLKLSGSTISGTPTTTGNFTFEVTASNSEGPDTKEFTITVDPIKVSSFDLSSLVTAPVKGQTPSTTAINTAQYTGTVSWSPSDAGFKGGTVYTATVTLTPKTNYTFDGVTSNSFAYTGATSVSNSVNSGAVSIVFPATAARVLNSITVNDAPNKTTYSSGENFDPAGLSLTLHYDDGTTSGVTYNDTTKADFSFNKSSLVTSDTAVQITYGGKNVSQSITVNKAKVTLNNLSALVTAPVKGETPSATAINTAQYTGTVSWSPSDVGFEGGKVYTATVTLTAKPEYTFTGVAANSFTCTGANSVTNSANSGTVSIVYPETAAKELNSITVNDAPNKTTYSSGENFDPSGLVLTLHYDDGTTPNVTYNDTTKSGFSFNKTSLSTSDSGVQITYGGKNVSQSITVNRAKVSSLNLSPLVTAPVKGQTPSTTSINTIQYSGTVTWSPDDAVFEGGKVYTATLTLTDNSEFTFVGVAANSFAYTGTTSVSNLANSGTVSIVFPATAAKVLNSITINDAPNKTTYSSGDSFDPDGLSLILHYDDGTTSNVTYSDATKSGFSFNKTSLLTSDSAVQITYGGKNVSQSITVNRAKVTLNNLSALVTAPVKGQTPSTTAINTAQYTGTVSWSPSDAGFEGGKVYTATVTLTTKSEYTFTGVTANSFTYTGATSVTNSVNSGTVSIVFPTTEAKVLNSITVNDAPTNTTYSSGESFDPSGLSLTLHYDDGTTPVITYSDATKAGFSFNKASLTTSDTAVQITYGGKNVSQSITVNRAKVTLNNLSALITAPVKGQTPSTTAINTTQYTGTVSWSPADVSFTGGTAYTATVTLVAKQEYTFTGVAANSFSCTGATSVSNSANSGTVTVVFSATEAKVLNSITINDAPTKTTYSSGENFDASGLTLTLHYDDGTTPEVTYSDATKANFSFNKASLITSDTAVQITYGGKNVSQNITVNRAKISALNLSALITAPVRGQAPNTAAIDTPQYTGTVTWNPVDAKFADSTVYTATVTLTAKAEYTFTGVAANSFTYTGSTSITNAANSGAVSIVFPATAAKVLNSIAVKNAPSKVTYVFGDTFNPAGLVLTLHYDDGTTADVNHSDSTKADFSFNKSTLAVSDKEVQITYKGKNINQAIAVKEKAAVPTNATPTNTAPTFITQTIVNNNKSVALSGSMASGISLNVVPIPTMDTDYTGMKKLIGNNEVLGAYHVTVTGGSYQGNLSITFTVGNRYNYRNATILHKKQSGKIETLSGIVKNGKVTVTVSELSPFIIMVQPAKSVPKTGDTTSNLPLIMLAIFTAIGFTAFILNRKRKPKDAK